MISLKMSRNFYIVLDFIQGGDLHSHVIKHKSLDEKVAKLFL